jgi:NlpC/P60 family putative phage cell wall peptidase
MKRVISPSRVVAAARAWVGTPYHHQACLKGVGTDCLGLLRGIYAELYGCPAPAAPPYTQDWAEALAAETLVQAADDYLVRATRTVPEAGDVLLFRFQRGRPVKHVGVAIAHDRFIHAVEGAAVQDVALVPAWRRRLAAIYQFPAEQS